MLEANEEAPDGWLYWGPFSHSPEIRSTKPEGGISRPFKYLDKSASNIYGLEITEPYYRKG